MIVPRLPPRSLVPLLLARCHRRPRARRPRIGPLLWLLLAGSVLPAHGAAQVSPVDEALAMAEERISRSSRDPEALVGLGEAAWRCGQLERAAEVFRTCLQVEPDHPRALAGLSLWHLVHGRDDEAERVARSAVRSDPDDAEPWLAWADVLLRRNRLEETEAVLARAMQRFRRRGLDAETWRRATWILELVRTRHQHPVEVDDLKRRGRLPLRLVGGCPIVDVELHDTERQPFQVPVLIDTGGSFLVMLDRSLRERVAFTETGRRPVETILERFDDAVAGDLPRLVFGEWTLSHVPAVFLPIRPSAGVTEEVLGNLGPWLIPDQVWALNFRLGYVSVREPRPDGLPLPFKLGDRDLRLPFLILDEGKAVLPLESPDGQVLALLDTGAARSYVSRRLAERGPVPPLGLGGWKLQPDRPQPLSALDESISPRLGVEISMLLGMDVLGKYAVMTLDYATQTLTLTPRGESRK